MSAFALILLAAIPTAAGEVAVVALGDDGELIAEVTRARGETPGALSSVDVVRRMTELDRITLADEAKLAALLEEARKQDGNWETDEANHTRNLLLGAFADMGRPSAAMIKIAASAAHEIAASLLAEGNDDMALSAAHSALHDVGDAPLDKQRLPPAVWELFERARAERAAQPKLKLTVRADRSGMLFVNGGQYGLMRGETTTVELPAGNYRVWLGRPDGASLPHLVMLSNAPVELKIDTELESRIDLHGSEPVLRCDTSCERDLRRLGGHLGVERVIGVGAGDAGAPTRLSVQVQAGDRHLGPAPAPAVSKEQTLPTGASAVEEPAGYSTFSPLYLIPVGGGQFAQGRWVFGAIYAAAQIGLWVWHAVSWVDYGDADRAKNNVRLAEAGMMVNVSLAMAISGVVLGVAEAIVVGLVFGDEEDAAE